MRGNEIMDPCFSAQGFDYVICLSAPWEATGIKLQLTKSLPQRFDSTGTTPAEPWAFELKDGQHCSYAGGATDAIGKLRLNYWCNNGAVYGGTDRTSKVWRVFFKRSGSSNLTRTEVRTAWL
jgi:hypothetical protein